MVLFSKKTQEEMPGFETPKAPTIDVEVGSKKEEVKVETPPPPTPTPLPKGEEAEEMREDVKRFLESYGGVFLPAQNFGTLCDLLFAIYDELHRLRVLAEKP